MTNKQAVRSENHVNEDIGDVQTWHDHTVEDDLVEACKDSVYSNDLRYFRNCLKKWGSEIGWAKADVDLCLYQDAYCWQRVWSICVTLRRLMPLWEHAANNLIQSGFDYRCLPPGTEFLRL